MSWLRELCPVELPAEELADALSVKGVHVEGILRPWDGLADVVVAQVIEVGDHPASDRLCVTRVSYGAGERTVVAGVRNMRPGDLVPLAGPGARVPALAEPLAERTLRGVVSEGMLCSARELGISADHGGILVLPPDSPVGADVKSIFGLDDAVLDIEIEPNRPDLMSVLGVARELAAATGVPVVPPDLSVPETEERAAGLATVEVRDVERCPRYLARVIRGVTIGPSSLRVQARLTAAGLRPLSNVVDATNYAMFEVGQPTHVFDLGLLAGGGVVVRRASEGERIVTLDGVDRALTPEDLVIADTDRAVAVAGVMGSATAEVHAGTLDVLLESAFFERTGVIRTSRRLGLQTEASLRFGRGADPESPPRGADLAARLMAEWADGSVSAGTIGAGGPPPRRRVALRPSRASALLGYPVTQRDVREVFGRLEIATKATQDDLVEVEVPGYRVDLDREVDLVEEVARIQGYDTLGTTLPGIKAAGGVAPTYALRRRARDALVRAGLRETISLSFASSDDLALTGAAAGVRIANPVAAERGFLRASLLPALLEALGRNAARGVRSAALFEVGHVFAPGDPVQEREAAAGALTGPVGRGLSDERRDFDFFDAKGAVEALMEALGVRAWSLRPEASAPFHPARSAALEAKGERIGALGELQPRLRERLDLTDRVALFEVDLSALEPHAATEVRYRPVSRRPPVHRDLAFVVDDAAPAGAVRAAIVERAGELLDRVELFDVFTGPPVPDGRKSLAFSLDFRATDRTLSNEEADEAVEAIARRLARDFGAELRSG